MRKQIRFEHAENMFGHTYSYQTPDHTMITVLENTEADWMHNHKRVVKPYFWFRAPTISVSQLAVTMRDLCDLATSYELKVWHSDRGLDASLKITDEMDAATWAWSHTEIWAKWSDSQEKEFVQSLKPRKLKVNKDGSVKVKVSVTTLQDP
jgi:hypothetical protein